jgi:taurine dioxygenase
MCLTACLTLRASLCASTSLCVPHSVRLPHSAASLYASLQVNQLGAFVQLYESVGRAGDPNAVARGSDYWHSDNSYLEKPAIATALYGVNLPQSGGSRTLLADTAAAYDHLPTATQKYLQSLLAEHSSVHNAGKSQEVPNSESGVVTAVHPVVRLHPHTHRPALYINPGYTSRLLRADRTPLDRAESDDLLQHLFRHILGPEQLPSTDELFVARAAAEGRFCTSFEWLREGDLLVWDNSRTIHRATTLEGLPVGQSRRMLRASVAGDVPCTTSA